MWLLLVTQWPCYVCPPSQSPFAVLTSLIIVVALHTKLSFRLTVGIGVIKILTLIFISVTGWVVLSGKTSIANPHANFENSFDGKATPYGLTNSLVKIIFSYAGYENAFNVVNEVKVGSDTLVVGVGNKLTPSRNLSRPSEIVPTSHWLSSRYYTFL